LLTHLEPVLATAALDTHDRVDRALLAFVESARARTGGDAVAPGKRAAHGFAQLGWRVLEAQAYETGRDERAARRAYLAIGAHGDVRRLERSLATDDATQSQSLLTPRERELARVVAAGKSNRAAALALSVSEKTVEKYLTSIYAKLGMTSRAQLIAYVSERKDLPEADLTS
jgi:DNA-binding CsgD family transcriptional regulator